MKPLTKDQRKLLLSFLSGNRDTPYNMALEFIVRTGVRTEEARLFRPSDSDAARGVILARGVKGSRDRWVPVDRLYASWLSLNVPDGGFEALTPDVSPASFKRILRRHWEKVRFQLFGKDATGVTLHGLRATVALAVYERGGKDATLVQEILGHVSLASTGKYIEQSRAIANRGRVLRALG